MSCIRFGLFTNSRLSGRHREDGHSEMMHMKRCKYRGDRLLPERRRRYQALTEGRAATLMAVVQGNRFRLWKNGRETSWSVPWRVPNGNALILKLEHLCDYNPSGSCYDRLYPYLFRQLEERRLIVPGPEGTPVIECSAGNAGAAFCETAVRLRYTNHTVIVPADIYPARIDQVQKYDGEVLFSPENEGELGYIKMIEDILRENATGKGRVGRDRSRLVPVTNTWRVPNEPYARLVDEVYEGLIGLALPPVIDGFMFGIGAGNTITQVGRALRSKQASPIDVYAVEFRECPFIAALKEGQEPYAGGGWPPGDMGGTIFGVPVEKLNLDLGVIDGVIALDAVEREEGRAIANDALGLCAGRPTGMGPAGLLKLANEHRYRGKHILTIVFDSIAKYETHYDAIMDVDFPRGKPIRASEMEQEIGPDPCSASRRRALTTPANIMVGASGGLFGADMRS